MFLHWRHTFYFCIAFWHANSCGCLNARGHLLTVTKDLWYSNDNTPSNLLSGLFLEREPSLHLVFGCTEIHWIKKRQHAKSYFSLPFFKLACILAASNFDHLYLLNFYYDPLDWYILIHGCYSPYGCWNCPSLTCGDCLIWLLSPFEIFPSSVIIASLFLLWQNVTGSSCTFFCPRPWFSNNSVSF